MQKRVLLIDDDPHFIERLREVLGTTVSLQVVSVADEVITTCLSWSPHLVVLDVLLGPGDPFQMLDEISSQQGETSTAVLCLSRGPGATTRLRAFGDTVFGTLKRETDSDSLRATIFRALDMSTNSLNPVAA